MIKLPVVHIIARKKNSLKGFRPGQTQIGRAVTDYQEAWNFRFRPYRNMLYSQRKRKTLSTTYMQERERESLEDTTVVIARQRRYSIRNRGTDALYS